MKLQKINSPILFLVLVILFPLFISSCLDNEDGGSQSIKKEKISGFVQKGPFVSGTTVSMSELNSELAQTGKIFTSQITNDQGLFEITNIELNSSFVEFSSSGFYFNEVTGDISSAPITLTSLSDLTNKSSINVNVLTHLEKKRVENLIKGGKTFSEAKKQAKNEVQSIFSIVLDSTSDFEDYDISKNTEEGGILLAISIILQGNRSVGQLTELLSKIQSDISTDGKLDDASILSSLRVSTLALDLASIRSKIESRNRDLNITSTVPNFEKHLLKFMDLKDLKITIEGEGTVLEEVVSNPAGREYLSGTTIKLTAIPKDGWMFDSWGGDLSGDEIQLTLKIESPKNISVRFKKKDYLLNITIEGEGTVLEEIIPNPSGREYPFQTVVKLTPVPKEGWVFDSWSGDLSGNEPSKTISMDKEKTVIVKFRNPVFRIAENGVTCICENVKAGDKGLINGIEYEAVDDDLLRKKMNEKVGDMTKLCTSLVTDLTVINMGWLSFNQPIGNWDVSNVRIMKSVFAYCAFNQDISLWDVSNVTNMDRMFESSAFYQDISGWCVKNIASEPPGFSRSSFPSEYKPKWGSCPD
jgi:surface protein